MSQTYRPSQLRFTHDSISMRFRDGRTIEETKRSIEQGHLRASDIETMVVMMYEGRPHVVYGNRRLYLFQQLERSGHLSRVTVSVEPFDSEIFTKMYTSKNGGKSVRLRNPRDDSSDDDFFF